MRIGIPTELASGEYRVGLTPDCARLLVEDGNEVVLQRGAGLGSSFSDREYVRAGVDIVTSSNEVWDASKMVVKVRGPLSHEYEFLRPGLAVFAFFNFLANPTSMHALLESGATCMAYEALECRGVLPLLSPQSEIAGRVAIQVGSRCLESSQGGGGVLLGGVPGVRAGRVLVLGAGLSGTSAAVTAAGMGANVTLMDVDLSRLRYLSDVLPANVEVIHHSSRTLLDQLAEVDLLIGAVIVEGARPPVVVSRKDLSLMRAGSVIVDIGVQQGGCVETSIPTTHSDPTYIVDGVVHWGGDLISLVPRTGSLALSNASVNWVRRFAAMGLHSIEYDELRTSMNIHKGRVYHPMLAEVFGLPLASREDL